MTGKKFRIPEAEIKQLVPDKGGCLATDKITVEGEGVGYMYRESPDNEFDSGWRFLSGTESPEYLDDPDNMDIYDLNTICNYDRAIIPYLDAEDETAFERIAGTDKFSEVPFDPEEDEDDE